MREFNANADQFEILPTTALQPDKSEWNFGTVAVFIHAYYPEMIVDLAGLVENIPARHHLFVTTASEENKQTITNHLL
ncbi:rhamnan synthesis F family protein, partial [Sulfitobacter sp. HI0076]